MSHARRLLPVLMVLALAPPAGAAPRTSCTSKLSAPQVTAGQAAKLSGRVTPHAARPVRLELRQGKRWTAAARKRSGRTGRFSFTLPTQAAATLTLRVAVPRTSRAKAGVCRAVILRIVPKGGGGGVQAKSEFLAVYALASDQTAQDGKLAAIRSTIDAVDGWFGTQTTGNVVPRWTRDKDGTVEVVTLTLAHSVSDYAAGGSFDKVVADLKAKGYPAGDHQKLAVFIDVTNDQGCGVTGSGDTILFEAACDIHPDANATWPFRATYLLAHEMTHNFGAVPDCAPHADGSGHVADDPRDVLYNGSGARDWDHLMLDPGHDDYYATGRSDCPGIE